MGTKTSYQKHSEPHSDAGSILKEIILGGQDGLVNVLGIVLGVAVATKDVKLVLLAGLAATFAESISMAAVAYTSTKAGKAHYEAELERERWEIKNLPEREVQEVRDIYKAKGFSGKQLEDIVQKITSNEELWLDTMMTEELRMFPDEYENPGRSAFIVGISALLGSLVPVIPFFFIISAATAMTASLLVSIAVLFLGGVIKSKITIGCWKRSGFEMATIGTLAALAGYAIGVLMGAGGL